MRAQGEGGKAKECTTGRKSRLRRDEKAPWALNYGSGEGASGKNHEYYFLNVPNHTFFLKRCPVILFCDQSYFYFQKVHRDIFFCTESIIP